MKSLILVTALIACISFNAKALDPHEKFESRNSKSVTAGSIPLGLSCVADSLKPFMGTEVSCEEEGGKGKSQSKSNATI